MSTKKKRKSPKPRQSSAPPTFNERDRVRVKYGVPDPDFPDIPLGGWTGIIAEVDQRGRCPLYLVEWNQSTLDHMHPVFRKRCDRDGLDETSSWLGQEDLESDSGEPVPMEQPINIASRPLSKNDREDRIRAIFGLTSDDPLPEVNEATLCTYHEHLAAHLKFPLQAIYWQDIGLFQSRKRKFSVVGLTNVGEYEPEEGYGLLCDVQNVADSKETTTVVKAQVKNRGDVIGLLRSIFGFSDRHEKRNEDQNCMPLSELEVKKDGPNRKLIADYSYWLRNF